MFWSVLWDFVDAGVAVCVAAFFVLVGVLVSVLSRIVPLVRCGVVGSAVTSTLAACAAAQLVPDCLFVCMIILIIRRRVVWSFFFTSSVIVHVPDTWRGDGFHCGVEEFESVLRWVLW